MLLLIVFFLLFQFIASTVLTFSLYRGSLNRGSTEVDAVLNRVGNLNFSALALWASDIQIVLARICFHLPNTPCSPPTPPPPPQKK